MFIEHPTHRARKRFGQNFLHDARVIDRIVRAINPKSGQRIVEIGPGQGALTVPLLEAAQPLHAVELDRDLAAWLNQQLKSRGLVLIEADALSFDFSSLATDDERLRVVGNLPYNISTPLMFHLLQQRHAIHDMHFMLQKEVVERLAAEADADLAGSPLGDLVVDRHQGDHAPNLHDPIGIGASAAP